MKSVLTRNCPVCSDNGFVEREENIAINIKRFIRKITAANNSEAFLIQTTPRIAEYINQNFICEWQNEFQRKIFIKGVPGFVWNKYRLEYQGTLEKLQEKRD